MSKDLLIRTCSLGFAAALGIFFVYSTAFSHSMMLHNAAHDTRHAIAAPCH